MPAVLNTSVERLLIAPQAAEGTPATEPVRDLQVLEGSIAPVQNRATVRYLDGNIFGRGFTYVQNVEVQGQLKIACTPEDAQFIYNWHFAGGVASEVPGVDGLYEHTTTSNSNSRRLCSIWQQIGTGTLAQKEFFADVIAKSVSLDAGADSSDGVVLNVEVLGLYAAVYEVDPELDPVERSKQFHWTQVRGSIEIGGDTVRGGNQLIYDSDNGAKVQYGDDVTPHAIVHEKGSQTLTANLNLDATGLAKYNLAVYGTEQPSAGDTPTSDVIEVPVTFTFSNGESGADERSLTFDFPAVALTPSDPITPDVGGDSYVTLEGQVEQAENGTAATTVSTRIAVAEAF